MLRRSIICIAAKRLQPLKETVPALSRLTVLDDTAANYNASVLEGVKTAAMQRGVGVAVVNASSEAEIEAAYAKLARERPAGILAMDNPIDYRYRQLISARAAAVRIPSMYPTGV